MYVSQKNLLAGWFPRRAVNTVKMCGCSIMGAPDEGRRRAKAGCGTKLGTRNVFHLRQAIILPGLFDFHLNLRQAIILPYLFDVHPRDGARPCLGTPFSTIIQRAMGNRSNRKRGRNCQCRSIRDLISVHTFAPSCNSNPHIFLQEDPRTH